MNCTVVDNGATSRTSTGVVQKEIILLSQNRPDQNFAISWEWKLFSFYLWTYHAGRAEDAAFDLECGRGDILELQPNGVVRVTHRVLAFLGDLASVVVAVVDAVHPLQDGTWNRITFKVVIYDDKIYFRGAPIFGDCFT